jgi:hypothetical protein
VRERLRTTPGRLELVLVAVLAGALCFGVVAGVAERSRERAAQGVRSETEPLLVQAVTLYASLSDANATATTTFLKGGLERPVQRARYLRDLGTASDSLATLTRAVGASASAGAAVATIAHELPLYHGLIESARANNRQGFPVGAAYLRQASDLLKTTILPAAGALYAIEATRLNDGYDTGTATITLVAFAAAVVVSVLMLALAQRYLTSVSRRLLNVPVVGATVVLLALSSWGLIALAAEQSALAKAQRDGSDSVEVLSVARILASRAQSDESLTLVGRGSDQTYVTDSAAVSRALGPGAGSGGLLGDVAGLVQRSATGGAAGELQTKFAAYQAQHARIGALEQAGRITDAIPLAVATSATISAADRLGSYLDAQIGAAQRRFESAAADATGSLAGLSVAIPVLTVLAAGLALLGLRQRINEYR